MSPLLFFFFFFFFLYITRFNVVPAHLNTFCNDFFFFPSTNTALRSNYDSLLSNLSAAANLSSSPGFDKYSTVGSPPLYGLYMCRGDVDPVTCRDCVALASADLSKNCPRGKQSAIWYDECMIRYSNASFFSKLADDPQFSILNTQNISGNVTQYDQLVLLQTLNNVANKAASGDSTLKFATEEGKFEDSETTIYVLGQCTPDLSLGDCSKCLHTSFNDMLTSSRGVSNVGYSCNLRFEFYAFYRQVSNSQAPANSRPADSPSHNPPAIYKPKRRHTILITASVIASIVLLLLGLVLLIHLHQRMRNLISTPDLTDILAVEELQMDLNTIRAATQNFSIHNKLGQGGFGSVFKGKLQNGQEIAVKRLSHNSGQGITEFKTEVIIVAKLQHRNLV